MKSPNAGALKLKYHPLTAERWHDLECLFGPRGACGGCWCMAWRLKRSDWEKGKGSGNKRAFKRIVRSGEIPGILAYDGDQPVGWCALAPRERYPVLERSRVLARVDNQPVWSVTCFFVARSFRRRGVAEGLLREAAAYAARQGAQILEGYPFEPRSDLPDPFIWTGTVEIFRRAGFREIARRSATRSIMRKVLSFGDRRHNLETS